MELKQKLRVFYDGMGYPILAALLLFLGHATGMEALFAILSSAAMICGLFFAGDLRFLLLPAFSYLFLVSTAGYTPNATGYERFYTDPALMYPLIAALGAFLVLLVWYLIRNRKQANPAPRGMLFVSMLIFSAALLFNGAFRKGYEPRNLLFAGVIVASLLLFYLLFSFYIKFDEKAVASLAFVLVVEGMLILAELFLALFTTVQYADGGIVKESVVLGWGAWTNIGGMLAFLMPACFYFASFRRHGWLWLALGLLEYLGILLSQSRGALLVGTGILALSLFLLCLRGENRKRNRIYTLILACGALAVAVCFSQKIAALVGNFLRDGLADNGRMELWRTGWENFLSHPIFGAGFYGGCENPGWDRSGFPPLYHNTPVQILATAGIFGIAAYLFHRFCTVRLAIRTGRDERLFLSLSVLALLAFSLIDVLFFKSYPTVAYAVILLFLERSEKFGR